MIDPAESSLFASHPIQGVDRPDAHGVVLVVMGVSGSGKSTVGEALAASLGWLFYDADDFHPADNVRKMQSGEALTDEDRWPWLDVLAALIREQLASGTPAVLACSALREAYRARIAGGQTTGLGFIYLHATVEALRSRMHRPGHFMPASLLDSQFDALEPPSVHEALWVDATRPVTDIVLAIRSALGLRPALERDV